MAWAAIAGSPPPEAEATVAGAAALAAMEAIAAIAAVASVAVATRLIVLHLHQSSTPAVRAFALRTAGLARAGLWLWVIGARHRMGWGGVGDGEETLLLASVAIAAAVDLFSTFAAATHSLAVSTASANLPSPFHGEGFRTCIRPMATPRHANMQSWQAQSGDYYYLAPPAPCVTHKFAPTWAQPPLHPLRSPASRRSPPRQARRYIPVAAADGGSGGGEGGRSGGGGGTSSAPDYTERMKRINDEVAALETEIEVLRTQDDEREPAATIADDDNDDASRPPTLSSTSTSPSNSEPPPLPPPAAGDAALTRSSSVEPQVLRLALKLAPIEKLLRDGQYDKAAAAVNGLRAEGLLYEYAREKGLEAPTATALPSDEGFIEAHGFDLRAKVERRPITTPEKVQTSMFALFAAAVALADTGHLPAMSPEQSSFVSLVLLSAFVTDGVGFRGGGRRLVADSISRAIDKSFAEHQAARRAGTFVAAYILGDLPEDYFLRGSDAIASQGTIAWRGGVELKNLALTDENFQRALGDKALLSRMLVANLAGIVTEIVLFGDIEAPLESIRTLQLLLVNCENINGLPRSESEGLIRWAAGEAVRIVTEREETVRKVAELMTMDRSVGQIMLTIEKSRSSNFRSAEAKEVGHTAVNGESAGSSSSSSPPAALSTPAQNPTVAKFPPRQYYYAVVDVELGDGLKTLRLKFTETWKDRLSGLCCVQVQMPLGLDFASAPDLGNRVQVVEVREGSSAEAAGVRTGDVIRAVSVGQRVLECDGLSVKEIATGIRQNSASEGGRGYTVLILERPFDDEGDDGATRE